MKAHADLQRLVCGLSSALVGSVIRDGFGLRNSIRERSRTIGIAFTDVRISKSHVRLLECLLRLMAYKMTNRISPEISVAKRKSSAVDFNSRIGVRVLF